MPGPSNRTIRTFRNADQEPLATLLRSSIAAGELSGFTSSELEGLIGAFPIARNLLVADVDGVAVGVICSDYRLLVVDPSVRRRGIGRALVDAMETALAATPDGPLNLFPPHQNNGARAFLEAIGFAYDHSSWRFELYRTSQIDLPDLPMGVSLDTYRDADIEEYIDLINTTFLDHPTPLRVTREQVEHVHSKASFDVADIALLREPTGSLIGFCTTGVDRSSDPANGTIKLLGVLRSYRGRGLGRYLLIWGIRRLRSVGVEAIDLSVDAQNESAVGLYRTVGFVPVEEWPQWTRRHTESPVA